jgi:hypothetical protein
MPEKRPYLHYFSIYCSEWTKVLLIFGQVLRFFRKYFY